MADNSKMERKLDYLEDTKSLIRIAMENKGLIVPSDLRFREYADLINNLELKTDESDSTVRASDVEYGKIAYNNNTKVVGTVPLVYDFTFTASGVDDDSTAEVVSGTAYFENRVITRDSKNRVKMNINYSSIPSYNDALSKVNNLLGE